MSAERQILGAMIYDNSLVETYPLSADDFTDKLCATIYRAMAALVSEAKPAGVEAIESRLRDTTGRDYLADIASIAINSTAAPNIAAYVSQFRREANLRRVRAVGSRLAEIESADEADGLIADLMAVGQTQINHTADLKRGAGEAVTLLEEVEAGKEPGLPTGLHALDKKLGGMQPSDLIIIGARSQHGKTALMLQIAVNQKVPVGLISGEQPNIQLGMRAIAQHGGVRLSDMRTGRLDKAGWDGVNRGVKAIERREVYTMDKGNPSINEIVGQARQWRHHHGIRALFVDYLQLVSGGSGSEHRLQMGDVVYRLKGLAKELNIPVIALAQVARAIDSYPEGSDHLGRMPYASNLADSAKLEDAADQIITLYRPEVYFDREFLKGIAYLNLCKNRHGPTGYVQTRWFGEFVRFGDAAWAAQSS